MPMTNSNPVEGLSAEALERVESQVKRGDMHGADAVMVAVADLKVALNAARSTPPVGWVLVPVEASQDMVKAGGHSNSEWLNDNAPLREHLYAMPMRSVWAAMIAARPLMEGDL